jgi:hypothetical protein
MRRLSGRADIERVPPDTVVEEAAVTSILRLFNRMSGGTDG